ncbi:MAG: metallophosphoesterase family protein [Desulfobacula sp.]|nr:metallophosphoesterase family protein [Desulfobacula sp.]
MRIYAVADIHGKTEVIEKIKKTVQRESPDLMVLAGDMTQYFSALKPLSQLEGFNIPVFAVRGNSDLKSVEALIRRRGRITLLGREAIEFLGQSFLGLNGTLPLPFVSKACLFESRRFREIENRVTPETILVVHPPPRGICDRVGNRFSAGSFGLRRFIENHPPCMVVCGHIHEQAGYQYLKNTLIVNCAVNKNNLGAIIDCEKNIPLHIKMVLNN